MNSYNKTGTDAPHFLVILYGTLEYDGRAQRMIEILTGLGRVTLVDINPVFEVEGKVKESIKRSPVALQPNSGKIIRHLRFWRAVLHTSWKCKPDIVVAENFFSTFPGWLSAIVVRALFFYDAYELIIPERNIPMSWRDRFWYLCERWTIKRANLVLAANPERARLMAEHYCLAQTPEYMRNIPSQQSQSPGDDIIQIYPALARRDEAERIILYQGDVSLIRGLAIFVAAMTYLPTHYRLVIVGDGPDLLHLQDLAAEVTRQGRFAVLGRVPNHLLPAITAQADVGIVTYPYEGLNNIYCSPNKIFEYAQAGLPVVATEQPPLKEMVESYGIGELLGRDDGPMEIADTLRNVVEHKERYCERLHDFLLVHTWQNESARVRRRIEQVLAYESKQ